jgi:integrase
MLLMLVGCRKEETASITWEQVHLEGDAGRCWLHLPDTKISNPVWLPLASQAVDLLKTRQRVEGSPFVFPHTARLATSGVRVT